MDEKMCSSQIRKTSHKKTIYGKTGKRNERKKERKKEIETTIFR